jgi:diguanylate cyclase (GGDEF)-like protein
MVKSVFDPIPIILLFTHSGSTRVFFKKTFREAFYILEVNSSSEVIEKLMSTKIEFVILDDKLAISLQELLKQIRVFPNLKQIPVLILSSNLKKSYMKELLTCGATEFLREPLDKETVLVTMNSATQLQAVQHKVSPLVQSIAQQLPSLAGKNVGGKKLASSRVSIHDLALKEINKAIQNKQSISLLMINADHLDKVEIRWGKPALEELLEKVEAALKALLRPQDILTHPNPERFIVILPKTSSNAAKILAENMKEGLEHMKFTTQKGTVKLPVVIGVVTLSEKDMHAEDGYTHLETMLNTGEAYLEKAKKIGKRIVSN